MMLPPTIKDPMRNAERITELDWTINDDTAKLLAMNLDALMGVLKDGRSANSMVAAWLASNGFDCMPDGRSGFLFRKDNTQYRLRVGGDKLSLAPSGCKGMGRWHSNDRMEAELVKLNGFLVCFCIDMPHAPIYALSDDFAKELKEKGRLSEKWAANSYEIRQVIMRVCVGGAI